MITKTTPEHRFAVRKSQAGDHTLIHAPTGSGKTLAAFLYTPDQLLTEPVPAKTRRCRVLYISPMKALPMTWSATSGHP